MSIIEAEEDGIEVIREEHSREIYFIPCEICGRKIRRTQYSRKRNYLCDYCKGVIKKKTKPKIPDGVTKHEIRYDKAVEKIKKSVSDFHAYERAIRIARTRCERYGSIPEAMVAIELLKNKYKIIPQQKIGKFKADFILPDIKVVLEIDGKIYHKDLSKEGYRDLYIRTSLGDGWKIIHYPAERVEQDITKLTKYIKALMP